MIKLFIYFFVSSTYKWKTAYGYGTKCSWDVIIHNLRIDLCDWWSILVSSMLELKPGKLGLNKLTIIPRWSLASTFWVSQQKNQYNLCLKLMTTHNYAEVILSLCPYEEVATWYLKEGCDYLAQSNHCVVIDTVCIFILSKRKSFKPSWFLGDYMDTSKQGFEPTVEWRIYFYIHTIM